MAHHPHPPRKGDVHGAGFEIREHLAFESNGCYDFHSGQFRGAIGCYGGCVAVGYYEGEGRSCGGFAGAECAFQDLSVHLRGEYCVVDGC